MRYYGEAGLGIRSKIVAGFLGIDLTSVEAKPSACVGLDRELNLIYSDFYHPFCTARAKHS